MKYIRVENNTVVGNPRELPISYNNISNFNLLDNAGLKLHGWFPYRIVYAHVTDDLLLDNSDIVIEENEVVEYQKTRPKTQNEFNMEIQSNWISIRNIRNQKLLESDWTQLADAPFTSIKKEEWKQYRQALRDITLQESPFSINWPIKPE